jgi:hypothetical protein
MATILARLRGLFGRRGPPLPAHVRAVPFRAARLALHMAGVTPSRTIGR